MALTAPAVRGLFQEHDDFEQLVIERPWQHLGINSDVDGCPAVAVVRQFEPHAECRPP